MLVDGVVIAAGPSRGALPGVVIAAGLGGSPAIAPGAAARWDHVTVCAVDPAVTGVGAGAMSTDRAVSHLAGRAWTAVQAPVGGSSPSPRAGHTGVAFEAGAYTRPLRS